MDEDSAGSGHSIPGDLVSVRVFVFTSYPLFIWLITVAIYINTSSLEDHTRMIETFTSRVLQTLAREVKVGETVSYKRLAEMTGNINAVQAVGGAMKRNPVPLLIPCHRVITSSGQSGSYMGGKGNHLKEWLLSHERQ